MEGLHFLSRVSVNGGTWLLGGATVRRTGVQEGLCFQKIHTDSLSRFTTVIMQLLSFLRQKDCFRMLLPTFRSSGKACLQTQARIPCALAVL